MRVLHVIPSLSPVHGGPSVALPLMARALADQCIEVDVATTDDDGPGKRESDVVFGAFVERPGFRLIRFPKQTEFYKVSFPLARWLSKHVRDYDLVHIHAIFSFSSNAAAWLAKRQGVPYIIRPLGLLNQWGMQNRRRLVKHWSFQLVERPLLQGATAMHYTSVQEQREASLLNLTTPAHIVPLGVDLEPFDHLPDREVFDRAFGIRSVSPLILFLSRLDIKKGVDFLIEAFAAMPDTCGEKPVLVIAGRGESGYVAALQARARVLGVDSRIVWAGHLDGEMKRSALSAADIFALPSHAENFGIALLEAMASGKACISSPEVALAEAVRDAGAVRVVERDIELWSQALGELVGAPDLRLELSRAARRAVREHFSLDSMGKGLKKLYMKCIR